MHRLTETNKVIAKRHRIVESDEMVALVVVAQQCPRRTLVKLIAPTLYSADSFMKRGSSKVTCYIIS
jgi:hypothetical protein